MNRVILIINFCKASINDFQEQLNKSNQKTYTIIELKELIKVYTDIKNHFEKYEYKETYKYIGWLNTKLETAIKKNDAHVIINALNDTIKLWNYYNNNNDLQEQINEYINYYI